MNRYYTRACNFYYGKNSRKLVNLKKTLPLNNRKDISFDNIQIISRNASRKISIHGIKKLPNYLKKQVKRDLLNITKKVKSFLNINFNNEIHLMGILNITPDHLDRHNGMTGYIAAKTRALTALRENGTAIIGQSDIYVRKLAVESINRGVKTLLATIKKPTAGRQHCLALPGDHNAENVAAARLALSELGLSDKQINHGIASFSGLPHRLQTVATIGSINFVDDSKATNGTAAAKAIATFSHIYWIAGGLAKEDGLDAVIPHIHNVKKAYLIGDSASAFASQLKGHCHTAIHQTLYEATHAVFSDAQQSPASGTILLAPAAASFDQFANFAQLFKIQFLLFLFYNSLLIVKFDLNTLK